MSRFAWLINCRWQLGGIRLINGHQASCVWFQQNFYWSAIKCAVYVYDITFHIS